MAWPEISFLPQRIVFLARLPLNWLKMRGVRNYCAWHINITMIVITIIFTISKILYYQYKLCLAAAVQIPCGQPPKVYRHAHKAGQCGGFACPGQPRACCRTLAWLFLGEKDTQNFGMYFLMMLNLPNAVNILLPDNKAWEMYALGNER